MWLNFIDTVLNFLLQDLGGHGVVGINLTLHKNLKEKFKQHDLRGPFGSPKTEKLHDQEMAHAVTELFLNNENVLSFHVVLNF